MAENEKIMPHVGQMLRAHVKKHRLYISGWAHTQGVKLTTVISYFKKTTMQIGTLYTISKVLKYNFIRDVADSLPEEFPPHPVNPLQAENDALKKEIELLKRDVATLERVLGVKKD